MTTSFEPPSTPPETGPPTPEYPMQPHRGGVILALGILGLVFCCILGIIAWVLGNNDLREMDMGRMDPTGRGLTNAGRICGIVAVCLAILAIIFYVVMAGVFGMMAAFPH